MSLKRKLLIALCVVLAVSVLFSAAVAVDVYRKRSESYQATINEHQAIIESASKRVEELERELVERAPLIIEKQVLVREKRQTLERERSAFQPKGMPAPEIVARFERVRIR